MKIELTKTACIVTREADDPKFYGIADGKGESALLFRMKQELKKQGYQVIKKRMWKDGHLVDDLQQYIRTEKGFKPSFCIYNPSWAINGAEKAFNNGKAIFSLERNIWKEKSNRGDA